MGTKGLEYSQYVCKESLAQQAGYAMAIKGPQHDEAWLIFMDMVNNQIPTFEDKKRWIFISCRKGANDAKGRKKTIPGLSRHFCICLRAA